MFFVLKTFFSCCGKNLTVFFKFGSWLKNYIQGYKKIFTNFETCSWLCGTPAQPFSLSIANLATKTAVL